MMILQMILNNFKKFSIESTFEDYSLIVMGEFSKFMVENKEDKLTLSGFKNLTRELMEKEMFFEFDEIVLNLYQVDSQFLIDASKTLTPDASAYVDRVIDLWKNQGQS